MAKGRLTVIGMLGMTIGMGLVFLGMFAFFGGTGDAACGGFLLMGLGLLFVVASWFARKRPRGAAGEYERLSR